MSTRAEEGMRAGFQLKLVMFEDQVMPEGIMQHVSTMRSRRVRDDDIFLCTFPKSGTHWVWEIINMIIAGKPDYAKHWQNSSFIESRSEEELETLPSPRILFTHLLPRVLPVEIWEKKCRVINVQRNPKDAIVSFYEQHTNQNWVSKSRDPAFTGSWNNYVGTHMKGQAPFDSVFDHMLTWNRFPKKYPDVPFLQIKYEDLKKDDVKEVDRIAKFLGLPLSEKLNREIAEACRFEKLKHASEHIKDQTFHNRWREGSSGYFRKGQVGDWKSRFTVAQSERFDALYEEKFQEKCPFTA